MNKVKTKSVFWVIGFALLLFFATSLSILFKRLPSEYAPLYSFAYVMSIGIHIALFSAWTVSIYNRIMQSRVRTYLMFIGVNILLWVGIRAVKWGALGKMILGDRIAWYMFYIPMIMIPLLFFFTALCVGEDENYRPNKKWNLLFIPAVLLIVLVLTNDFHLLVFDGFNLNIHMYERAYDHRIGYFVVAIFLLGLILLSTTMIVKKFHYSVRTRRASRLPMLVVGCVILYTALLVSGPIYGVEYYFMDVTIFLCVACVAFWEACIRTGLVHSNNRHKEFFEMATTKAQILTHTGKVVYTAKNVLPLTHQNFKKLKKHKSADYDENTLLHISPIKGGYVSWLSDVSGIKNAIVELEKFNEGLYEEINILTLENEQKKEKIRIKKLSELQSVLLTETLPHSEKIKNTVMANENTTLEGMKQLLFEASMVSTYLKRKINLILTAQTENHISTDELRRAFMESFQLLDFLGRNCGIHIADDYELDLGITLLCYDFYHAVIEKVDYNFESIFLSYNQREKGIVFSLEIEGDAKIQPSDFEDFEREKISQLGAMLNFAVHEDSYYLSISIPK